MKTTIADRLIAMAQRECITVGALIDNMEDSHVITTATARRYREACLVPPRQEMMS